MHPWLNIPYKNNRAVCDQPAGERAGASGDGTPRRSARRAAAGRLWRSRWPTRRRRAGLREALLVRRTLYVVAR